MNFEKDTRRRDKFDKGKKHFATGKYQKKTKRDFDEPRTRPAEDQSRPGSRQWNRNIALKTVSILEDGKYEFNDKVVDISAALDKAYEDTITYMPDRTPLKTEFEKHDTVWEVELETTLSACRRYCKEGLKVCALNFASAKNPGGGFLTGSSAQEESLARASGLYQCISGSEMYDINRKDNNFCLYSDAMIYSPNVPVFRNDGVELIETPYYVSFITAPAPNTNEARKRRQTWSKISDTMYYRAERVLSLAAYHKQDVLVLGSWGCGVFGGDIDALADIFHHLLTDQYAGAFSKVVFSTLSRPDYDTFRWYFK